MALALPGTAHALVTEEGSIQCNAQAYIQADGHAAMAPDELLPADWYSDRVFPGQDKTQMSAPDSHLDAATRAMLLVEQKEPAAERARWSLSYRVLAGSQDEPHINACTLVELRRYNLTRAAHAQLLKDYPDANPEPLGKDAELPHISWRFWFATTQGMQADVMAASRRTLTDAEAANALCLDRPCLEVDALHTLLDQPGTSDWTPEKLPAKSAYQAPAVRAVEELFHGALSGGDPLPAMFEDDPVDAPLQTATGTQCQRPGRLPNWRTPGKEPAG